MRNTTQKEREKWSMLNVSRVKEQLKVLGIIASSRIHEIKFSKIFLNGLICLTLHFPEVIFNFEP
jgi:hypothetical protein